ncbi:hypothetical protein ColLi_12205 [Colletotrichum liriopes]|uniref:Uncharacterized protein n=1 Tax=Colletotrichum liriopes TaxID=708192 RepID=A0AA37LYF8_9PEZI|nr:hypothetical protein ColLi_12205 [Colletotrichum liriopes]
MTDMIDLAAAGRRLLARVFFPVVTAAVIYYTCLPFKELPQTPPHPAQVRNTHINVACIASHTLCPLNPGAPPTPFELLNLDPSKPTFLQPNEGAYPGVLLHDGVMSTVLEAGLEFWMDNGWVQNDEYG